MTFVWAAGARDGLAVSGTVVLMGRQSETWILSHHSVAGLLVFIIGLLLSREGSNAQQLYNSKAYNCSDSGNFTCNTFALYRAQQGYKTVPSVAALFNTNSSALAELNTLTEDATLAINQAVIVPLTCACSNHTSHANLTYTIANQDTYYSLSMSTFESLSTANEVIEANPALTPQNLTVGGKIIIPVRCACPSRAETAADFKSLVTYPILIDGESASEIANSFGVLTNDILAANMLNASDAEVYTHTTILVPISTNTPNYTDLASSPSAPAPPAGPSSPSGCQSTSKTSGYVVTAAVMLLVASSI